jgi:peroxiredoxin
VASSIVEVKMIKKGEKAPNFTLKDQGEKDIKLADFKGKKVLLSFHPLAWTSVCAKQMQSLETNKDTFKKLNTVALGVNVDPVPSKAAWAKSLKIKSTKLLSDFWPHGEVAKKYGIFSKSQGFSLRVNIIIDERGRVVFVKKYPISKLPDIKEIIKELSK